MTITTTTVSKAPAGSLPPVPTPDDLHDTTVKDLRKLAAFYEIALPSKAKREVLVNLVISGLPPTATDADKETSVSALTDALTADAANPIALDLPTIPSTKADLEAAAAGTLDGQRRQRDALSAIRIKEDGGKRVVTIRTGAKVHSMLRDYVGHDVRAIGDEVKTTRWRTYTIRTSDADVLVGAAMVCQAAMKAAAAKRKRGDAQTAALYAGRFLFAAHLCEGEPE